MPAKDQAAEPSPASVAAAEAALAEGPAPRVVDRANLQRGYVVVRVTKKGHKKIHAGGTVKSLSDDTDKFNPNEQEVFPLYNYKDEIALPVRIAQAQEENGYAEIQD